MAFFLKWPDQYICLLALNSSSPKLGRLLCKAGSEVAESVLFFFSQGGLRVCFSTNLPIYRRMSSFLDNPHLPSFACDSKAYSTFGRWFFIILIVRSKDMFPYTLVY